MINWGEFKTQWVRFWQRFSFRVKTKPHQQNAPPAIKSVQPFNPVFLFYFVEHGRRSYKKGISFAHWSDRMIVVHSDDVIPYLRAAWKYVKEETFPIATGAKQNGNRHNNGKNSTYMPTPIRNASWIKFLTEFHWTSFVGGFVICLFLCAGFFYAVGQRYKIVSTPVAAIRSSGFTGFQGFRGFGQTSAPAHPQTMRIDTWTGRAWIYNDSNCTWQPITESK